MTAQWESQLEAISQREIKYQQFMQPMLHSLGQLVDEVGSMDFQGLQGMGKSSFKKRRKPTQHRRTASRSKKSS